MCIVCKWVSNLTVICMCAHLIKSAIVAIAIKRAKAAADTWLGCV